MAHRIRRLRSAQEEAERTGNPYAYAIYEVLRGRDQVAVIQHDGSRWTLRPEENHPRVMFGSAKIADVKAKAVGATWVEERETEVDLGPLEGDEIVTVVSITGGGNKVNELVWRIRQIRYVANSLRAQCAGMAAAGVTEQVREAGYALARARDQLGLALRELGDAPLEGDPQ